MSAPSSNLISVTTLQNFKHYSKHYRDFCLSPNDVKKIVSHLTTHAKESELDSVWGINGRNNAITFAKSQEISNLDLNFFQGRLNESKFYPYLFDKNGNSVVGELLFYSKNPSRSTPKTSPTTTQQSQQQPKRQEPSLPTFFKSKNTSPLQPKPVESVPSTGKQEVHSDEENNEDFASEEEERKNTKDSGCEEPNNEGSDEECAGTDEQPEDDEENEDAEVQEIVNNALSNNKRQKTNNGYRVPVNDLSKPSNLSKGLKDVLANHHDAALLFTERYGKDNLKITDYKTGEGYRWNENTKLWQPIHKGQINLLIGKIFGNIADNYITDIKLKNHIKSQPFCSSVTPFICGLCEDTEFEKKIDAADPNFLPIRNGSKLDLQTLEIQPRTREDFWSFESPCTLLDDNNPLSDMTYWVNQTFAPDIIPFIQKCGGYACTGRTDSNVIIAFWGEGRNGKSTFCRMLRMILTSKLYLSASRDAFIQSDRPKSEGAPSAHLASLEKKRAAILSELKQNDRLNDLVLKSGTGEDPIRYRSPYATQEKDLIPIFKPILCTNHKPIIDPNDQAFVYRWVLVPFLYSFVDNPSRPFEKQKDPELVRRLLHEKKDEVFTWFMRGAREWYNNMNLRDMPISISQATQEHLDENDPIRDWLDYAIERTESNNDEIQLKDLFASFNAWFNKPDSTYSNRNITSQNLGARLRKEFPWKKPQNKLIFYSIAFKKQPSSFKM